MTLTKWDDERNGEIQITGEYEYYAAETRGCGTCEITTPESENFWIDSITFGGIDVTEEYENLAAISAWCLEHLPEE
jgi:hypothetical protein